MVRAFLILTALGQPPAPSPQFPAPKPPAAADTAPGSITPAPQTITLQVVPAPAPAPPVAADTAPKTITLNVQAPTPPPQTITLQVVPQIPAAVAPAQAPPVAAQVRYPGPIRTAVGNYGEWLARFKQARVYVPLQQADVRVIPASAAVQLVQQPQPTYVAAPVAAETLPVFASPQGGLAAPGKHRLLNLFR